MKLVFLASLNSIHTEKWLTFFADKCDEIVCLSNVENRIVLPGSVVVRCFPSRFKIISAIRLAFELVKIIRKSPVDLVHVHSYGFYAFSFVLASCFVSVKCASTPWGSDVLFGKNSWLKVLVLKRLVKLSMIITTDALHMRSELLKLGASKSQIKIINFGVDTKRFRRQTSVDGILDVVNKGSRKLLISTRNFEPVYDVSTLIRATAIIKNEVPDVLVGLVGRGSLQRTLEYEVEMLGLEQNITFIGYVDNAKLPTLLSYCDLYVSTSLSDAGLAASTAEAMACEAMVLVSDTGENCQWIRDGENGCLFASCNHEQLAGKAIKMLGSKDRSVIGGRARQTIVANNDYETEMTKMLGVYRQIIKTIE